MPPTGNIIMWTAARSNHFITHNFSYFVSSHAFSLQWTAIIKFKIYTSSDFTKKNCTFGYITVRVSLGLEVIC